jgi:hypothetical protein
MVPYLCSKCEKILQPEEVLNVFDMIDLGKDAYYENRYCPICNEVVYDIWEIKKYYKLYNHLYGKLRRIERK